MKTILLASLAMLTIGTAAPKQSQAETTRHFYWEGIWMFPDCYYQCDYNSPASGCLTDPDCKCTCFQ